MRLLILRILTLLAIFYHIYPQALNVLGSSYIVVAGPIGIVLYAYNGFPFRKEVFSIAFFYCIMLLMFKTTAFMTGYNEPWVENYTKSQLAWFFSAYLCVLLLFSAHEKPTFEILAYYIVFAMAAQAVISILMTLDPAINKFFLSIQLQADLSERKMIMSEGKRIVGYGTGFFGAGVVYGYGLIFNAYLLAKAKMDLTKFILMAATYCLIFYVGLFSARTTVVGLGISLTLIAILYLIDSRTDRNRVKTAFIIIIFLGAAGYTLTYIYFPSMTEWAFELFDNIINKGEITTRSSNDIEGMFAIPSDINTLLYGDGNVGFSWSDVGYTRMLFYAGVPGTLLYYGYLSYYFKISFTKDWTINLVGIACIVQMLVANIKGLIDMTFIATLYFMFFAFYKYYVFQPKVYMRQRQQEELLKSNTKSRL